MHCTMINTLKVHIHIRNHVFLYNIKNIIGGGGLAKYREKKIQV